VSTPRHEGRVAVVTGAARGFGRSIALELAREGAAVAVVDLLDASKTVTAIQDLGVHAHAVRTDITDPVAVAVAADEILERFGHVDILVNNAGIITVRDFWSTDYSEWRRIHAINLDSQFLLAKAFAGSMRDSGWGRIVNIASNTVGLVAPALTAYIASKGGVIGFTRGLATDLAPFGITVNAVAPTASTTPGGRESITQEILDLSASMQAIKRIGTEEDIAGVVSFLCSDHAAFITAQTIFADGGWVRS
jgi:3-oxoacyl-[acyl-carrier protein] reductase